MKPILIGLCAMVAASGSRGAVVKIPDTAVLTQEGFGNPGDEIDFSRNAVYELSGKLLLPPGRKYFGQGATLHCTHDAYVEITGAGIAVEFTGFTLDGGGLYLPNGSYNIHDNTITRCKTGATLGGISRSHIDRNTFTRISEAGIYGYPGDDNTYNNNTFDDVLEPIHLTATNNHTEVNGNVMTRVRRFGIELQNAQSNLSVLHNVMSNFTREDGAPGAISCATAGGVNIEIGWNVLLNNGLSFAKNPSMANCMAIEIMGTPVNIHDNYVLNLPFLLNGAGCPASQTPPQGVKLLVSNNVLINSGNIETGRSSHDAMGDATQWTYAEPIATGNRIYAPNDPNAPAPPPAAASLLAPPAVTPAAAPATQSASPSPTVVPATQSSEIDADIAAIQLAVQKLQSDRTHQQP